MDSSDSTRILNVSFSAIFAKNLTNFPKADKQKIYNFTKHIEKQGFEKLPGKFKKSNDVDKNDPNFLLKATFANENNLWHYHIGIPKYEECKGFGNFTSRYILHYTHIGNEIKIVDMSDHPPFELPDINLLK